MITIKTYFRKHRKESTNGFVWVSFYVQRQKVNFTTKVAVVGKATQREIAHEMTKIEPAISLPIEIIDVPERPGFSVVGIHCDAAKFGDAPYTYDGRAYY